MAKRIATNTKNKTTRSKKTAKRVIAKVARLAKTNSTRVKSRASTPKRKVKKNGGNRK
jgi:hypothetical protein